LIEHWPNQPLWSLVGLNKGSERKEGEKGEDSSVGLWSNRAKKFGWAMAQ